MILRAGKGALPSLPSCFLGKEGVNLTTTWFRLHSRILNDRKVQTLPSDLFRHWINSMAVASEREGYLPSPADYAFEMRISASVADKVLRDLISAKLIDPPDSTGFMKIHDWDDWQYVTDKSRDRMRHLRAKKASQSSLGVTVETVTSDGCDGPKIVTSDGKSDATRARVQNRTDTDTDTYFCDAVASPSQPPLAAAEKVDPVALKIESLGPALCERHPKHRTCGPAEAKKLLGQIVKKLPARGRLPALEEIDDAHACNCASDQWTKEGGQYCPSLKNWLAPTMERWKVKVIDPPAANGVEPHRSNGVPGSLSDRLRNNKTLTAFQIYMEGKEHG